ncbi:MAG: 3,4-dihydroxy-2-butanone-4-phosphate synthase [Hadesarchaea archaeon]|nr:MAG: 3,4-dihydroxy-2-butanone-4-phosphate synthase [Hadesarchaea archaeon]TDA32820.1 MAG: 3,4-dihydroxy-2-butanone-4-phosphate synthase [Hadesarchaea archaeon]
MEIEEALRAMKEGRFVLIHDSDERENEVDLVMGAQFVEPRHVAILRKEAGGLICVSLHRRIADNFGLPYLTEIYRAAAEKFRLLRSIFPHDLPYDERSAFSLTVNHRRTRTGITDRDRALTIRELARMGAMALNGSAVEEFGKNFRSPGHVPLLPAAESPLERQGHTELSVALAEMAGIIPVTVICEMLDEETHAALSVERAKEYAEERGLVLLEGREIVEEYRRRRS